MDKKLVVVTDSCSDLTEEIVKEFDINVIPMHFSFNNEQYVDDINHSGMSIKDFYDRLRNKEVAITSQATVDDCVKYLKPFAEKNYDVLLIAFSSALSGTYNSMNLAANILKEEYNDFNIKIVDSLCASFGEGFLTYLVCKEIKDKNLDLNHAYNFAESIKGNINHYFIVDDLGTLKRGGRLSATKAFLGSLLNLKPILHVSNEGKLVPINKKLGRKASIISLFDYFKNKCINHEVVFISHGDCLEDALLLKKKIENLYNDIKVLMVGDIGPVIGAHSGPGTLAVYFIGEGR